MLDELLLSPPQLWCRNLQSSADAARECLTNPFTRDHFVNPFGCGQTSSLYQDRFQAFVFIGPERLK